MKSESNMPKQESAPAAEQLSAEQVWFQAACSGLWYQHPGAAASVCAIKMGDRRWTPAPNGYFEEKPHDPTPSPAQAEDIKCPKCGNIITPMRECWACHAKIPAAEQETFITQRDAQSLRDGLMILQTQGDGAVLAHFIERLLRETAAPSPAQEKPRTVTVRLGENENGDIVPLAAQEKPVAASVDGRWLFQAWDEAVPESSVHRPCRWEELHPHTRQKWTYLAAALASASSPSAEAKT